MAPFGSYVFKTDKVALNNYFVSYVHSLMPYKGFM